MKQKLTDEARVYTELMLRNAYDETYEDDSYTIKNLKIKGLTSFKIRCTLWVMKRANQRLIKNLEKIRRK